MTSNTRAMPIPYCISSLFFAFFCLSFTRLFYHLSSFITSEDRNMYAVEFFRMPKFIHFLGERHRVLKKD